MRLRVIIEGQLSFVNLSTQIALEPHLLVVFIVHAYFMLFLVRVVFKGQRTISALERLGIHMYHNVTI